MADLKGRRMSTNIEDRRGPWPEAGIFVDPSAKDWTGRQLAQSDATLSPWLQNSYHQQLPYSNPEKDIQQSARYSMTEGEFSKRYEYITDEEFAQLHAANLQKMSTALDTGAYPSGKKIPPDILQRLKDAFGHVVTKGSTPYQTHQLLGLYSDAARKAGIPEGQQVAQYDPLGDYEQMLIDLSRRQRESQGFPPSRDHLRLFPRGGEGFKDLPEDDVKKIGPVSMLSANDNSSAGRAIGPNDIPVYKPNVGMDGVPVPANQNYPARVQKILEDYKKVFNKE